MEETRGRRTRWPTAGLVVAEICRRVEAGERIGAVLAEPGMPSQKTLFSWLRRRPELGAMYRAARASPRARLASVGYQAAGRPRLYSQDLAEAVCEAIAMSDGGWIGDDDPAMPSRATVYRWLKTRPAFAEMYALAREFQAHRLMDEAWAIAEAATPQTVRAARLKIEAIRWRVSKIAPRRYHAGDYGPAPDRRALTVRIVRYEDDEARGA